MQAGKVPRGTLATRGITGWQAPGALRVRRGQPGPQGALATQETPEPQEIMALQGPVATQAPRVRLAALGASATQGPQATRATTDWLGPGAQRVPLASLATSEALVTLEPLETPVITVSGARVVPQEQQGRLVMLVVSVMRAPQEIREIMALAAPEVLLEPPVWQATLARRVLQETLETRAITAWPVPVVQAARAEPSATSETRAQLVTQAMLAPMVSVGPVAQVETLALRVTRGHGALQATRVTTA